jgi:hypothetical protein
MSPLAHFINQDNQEILKIQILDEKGAYIRAATCKALENCLYGTPSRGYAIYQTGDEGLAFAVLEGVSSTFHSEIAAEYLGKRLVDFLWNLSEGESSDFQSLRSSLVEMLGHWTPECQEQLKEYDLDGNLSELLRESMQEIREIYGSETHFGCGRVWRTAEGARQGIFFWAGNICMQVWDTEGNRLPLQNSRNRKNCWSSKHGLKGQLSGWKTPPETHISYINAHTIGFTNEINPSIRIADRQLVRLMIQGLLEQTRGDQVHLEIILSDDQEPEGRQIKAPKIKDARIGVAGEYHLTWKAETGKPYELEISEDFGFLSAERVEFEKGNQYVGKLALPGRYYARLRRKNPSGAGPWSKPVCLVYPGKNPPSALPTIIASPSGGEDYEVRWEPVKGAIFYVLESVERDKPENFYITALTSDTCVNFRGRKKPNLLRLRAVNEDGESTAIRLETGIGGSPLYSQEIPEFMILIGPEPQKTIKPRSKKPGSRVNSKDVRPPDSSPLANSSTDIAIREANVISCHDEAEGKFVNIEDLLMDEKTERQDIESQPQDIERQEMTDRPPYNSLPVRSPEIAPSDEIILPPDDSLSVKKQELDLLDETFLPPPSFIHAKVEKKLFFRELKLWWAEVQGREEFEIWISQQPLNENNQGHHFSDVKHNSYAARVTNYSPGIYYFRVRARSQGKTGHWSKTVEARLNIGRLDVQVQKGELPASIRVSWKMVEGALAYEVCGLAYNQSPQPPVKLEGTSYLYEKLTPGHYQYRVRAVFEGGIGEWENPKDQKPIIVPEPLRSAPRHLIADCLINKRISLSWTPVEGALVDGYRLEADIGKGRFENISPSKYKIKETPNKVNIELPKMFPGNYSFRVCAYNFSGSGPWSNITKIEIPGEIQFQAPEEPPLPIDKETLLVEKGSVYDWGFVAHTMVDLVQEKRLRVARYILQEKQAVDQFKTIGEYNELLRPFIGIDRDYRYALFDMQEKLLAVVSFSIKRNKFS